MRFSILSFFVLISVLLNGQSNCQTTKFTPFKTGTNIDYNSRSDTFDLEHIHIDLDLVNLPFQGTSGKAVIDFTTLLPNSNQIRFDLQALIVDSVFYNGQMATFSNVSPHVIIQFPTVPAVGSTDSVEIFYQGVPPIDPTNWGGVHFDDPYFYNLGVGFGENPHVYGRAWFPCFDNFVEKSTYSISVTTNGGRKAFANGTLKSTQTVGTNTRYDWEINQEIPSYLASFAISNYAELTYTHTGLNGNIPVSIAARPQDTTNAKASFINLPGIIDHFETSFGAYAWEKIGYALTQKGAMEHATSIHLPVSLANGSLSGEDIIAHELAHHWWGNLITCETAEDMWINEGMAEYSSHLYTEGVYGQKRYLNTVQDNQDYVLKVAHRTDGGYYPIAGIPHSITYGTHVYQKGAMVGHNLRNYLGDSTFFASLTTLLNQNAFGNLSTDAFEVQLETITNKDLTPFFDQWVKAPGFPQFSIDSSLYYWSSGNLALHVVQRLHQAPSMFTHVPLEVVLMDSNGNRETHWIEYGTSDSTFFVFSSITPEMILLNPMGRLLTATTVNFDTIKPGTTTLSRARVTVNNLGNDSATFYAAHHLVAPGGDVLGDYKISNRRYFTFKHLSNAENFSIDIPYNGDKGQNGIDTTLLQNTEDSLKLLYRPTGKTEWQLYPYYSKNQGFPNDKKGVFSLSKVLVGDYVFANGDPSISIKELSRHSLRVKLFPNPTKGDINIMVDSEKSKISHLEILSIEGKTLLKERIAITAGEQVFSYSTDQWPSGSYLVKINGQTLKFIIE